MSHATVPDRAATDPVSGRGFVLSPGFSRGLLLVVIVAAGVGGLFATDPGATSQALAGAGADWARLLRAMAALKLVFAAAAAAAVFWRLAAPVSPARFGAYAVSAAATWFGPGLIWNLRDVGLGAFLLHAGLVSAVVLLWLDPGVAALVSGAVARRRARVNARGG